MTRKRGMQHFLWKRIRPRPVSDGNSMLRLLRIFFHSEGTNQLMVLLCLVVAGLAEGVGLASLLPVFSLVGDGEVSTSSELNRIFISGFSAIGLRPSIGILLTLLAVGFGLKAALTLFAMRYIGYAVAEVATRALCRVV